ncbi:MAG: hypothetical protein AAF202_11350, partial [Pseudomonadota bacterium]
MRSLRIQIHALGSFLQVIVTSTMWLFEIRKGLHSKCVFVLLLGAFSFEGYGVEYRNVPRECRYVLNELLEETANDTVVDWSDLKKQIYALGYSRPIATEKLEERASTQAKDKIVSLIQVGLADEDWQFDTEFSESEMQKFASFNFSSYHLSEILSLMAYFSSIPGFDSSLFVYSQYVARDREVDIEDLTRLLKMAPLWMQADTRIEIVNALISKFAPRKGDPFRVVALLNQLSVDERELAGPAARKFLDSHMALEDLDRSAGSIVPLQAAAVLPYEQQPDVIKDMLGKFVNLKKYRPITLRTVETLSCATHDAGDCEEMTQGHLGSLMVPDSQHADQSLFLTIGTKVLGQLKLVGDHSFMAFRNVFDESGRLVLAMGGVYHLSSRIYYDFESKDLIEMGFTPGPWFGPALDEANARGLGGE